MEKDVEDVFQTIDYWGTFTVLLCKSQCDYEDTTMIRILLCVLALPPPAFDTGK